MTSAPGSVSGGRAGKLKPDRGPLRGLPTRAAVRAAAAAVVMVAAKLSPHDAWRQPILRLADTAIGVAVGLAAAWLGLRAVRPLIRPSTTS
jgi:hypothetical protein